VLVKGQWPFIRDRFPWPDVFQPRYIGLRRLLAFELTDREFFPMQLGLAL
jgi:hypothetical protein